MHGKAERGAPWKQTAGAVSYVPRDAIAFKNISHMPMANQHVPDSELVQKIYFPRAIRLIDDPIRLRVWRNIVPTFRGNVLDADNNVSAAIVAIGVIVAAIICVGLAPVIILTRSAVPPVTAFAAIILVTAGALARKPSQHCLRFRFRL